MCDESVIKSSMALMSALSRVVRSPVRWRSWKRSDSRCMCANSLRRKSKVKCSPTHPIARV